MENAKKMLIQNEDILITELYDHGSHKAKEKDKYKCVHCTSSNGLSISKDDEGNYYYHCFVCGKGGNVIKLVQRQDLDETKDADYYKAMEQLCKKHNIPFTKSKTNVTTGVDKSNVVNFYETKFQEAAEEGDQVVALRALREKEQQEQTSYFMTFPFLSEKDKPLPIWENVEAVIDKIGYKVVYNVITKELEILGSKATDINDQIMDVHSACHKYGFKVGKNFVEDAVNRISADYKINPATDYLEKCEFNYNGEATELSKVCDSLIVPESFPESLKITLVTKWLLGVANIAYNEGYSFTEGCLVLQGKQNDGKTTWIRRLIPAELLKTGLSLNPDNKDSVVQATRYWVVELGELGSTMKNEQSKLKAYFTEPVDEYRVPYARRPKRFNRTTAYFGTVNEANFLKDVTGDRRFWVIPIDGIDRDLINSVDRDKLWGEIMAMLPDNLNNLGLNKDELEMLYESNSQFRVKGATQIAVEAGFGWGSPEDTWIFMTPAEIAKKLGLHSTTGLKEALLSCGAKEDRPRIGGKQVRGYLVPPFISVD